MNRADLNLALDEWLRIRKSFDRATEQLSRAENALRVAGARLDVLAQSIERAGREQHPTPA